MPDGTRKRRFSDDPAKRRWYAEHRSKRFRKRFSLVTREHDDHDSVDHS